MEVYVSHHKLTWIELNVHMDLSNG